MSIIKVSKIIVSHSNAFFNQVCPIRIEFILQFLLLLLRSPIHSFTPHCVHAITRSQPSIDLLHYLPEQLRVFSLLNLVVGHAQRLELRRRVVHLVGDEDEPHDLRTPRVQRRVRLDIELVAAHDRATAPLVSIVAPAVGIEFVDHRTRGLVIAVHVGRR
ncbi:hypothetical protein V8G54_009083 [Vigna mungo]|uniref:Uncharacterized protein n=1 Tax=Vigna mungo TaxID=3915 RepID=A0AAQ3NW29_VIGMU